MRKCYGVLVIHTTNFISDESMEILVMNEISVVQIEKGSTQSQNIELLIKAVEDRF